MKKIAEKTQEYYINFINDNDWWFNDATIDDRQAIIHAGSKMKYDLIEQHDASHESERIKDILAEKNSLLSNCDSTIKHQYDMILQKEEDNQKILAELQLEKSNLLIEKDKMRQDAEISAMNRVDNELSLLKIRLNDHQNMMDKLKINENER